MIAERIMNIPILGILLSGFLTIGAPIIIYIIAKKFLTGKNT